MVANFGDSKVANSESSFASYESGSSTPRTNTEDSGIEDRSGSLEKVNANKIKQDLELTH